MYKNIDIKDYKIKKEFYDSIISDKQFIKDTEKTIKDSWLKFIYRDFKENTGIFLKYCKNCNDYHLLNSFSIEKEFNNTIKYQKSCDISKNFIEDNYKIFRYINNGSETIPINYKGISLEKDSSLNHFSKKEIEMYNLKAKTSMFHIHHMMYDKNGSYGKKQNGKIIEPSYYLNNIAFKRNNDNSYRAIEQMLLCNVLPIDKHEVLHNYFVSQNINFYLNSDVDWNCPFYIKNVNNYQKTMNYIKDNLKLDVDKFGSYDDRIKLLSTYKIIPKN